MKLFFILAGLFVAPLHEGFHAVKTCETNNISTEDACEIYVPNVFSPNGDALNDYFKPSSNCSFESFEMKVFSRWGQLVYNSRNAEEGWNGESAGEPAPAAVYTWVISYTFQPVDSLSTGKMSGDVTLIR